MAVCQSLRTREGVVRFLLQSENGDESLTAFEYADKKIEVHSLKRDCAPLCLEEDTSLAVVTLDDVCQYLVAATLSCPTNSIVFRLWDASNTSGFAAKEICTDALTKQEYKNRFSFNVKSELDSDLVSHSVASINQLLLVVINKKFLVLWSLSKLESGVVLFDKKSVCDAKATSPITDAIFLQKQGEVHLVLTEGATISVWDLDQGVLPAQKTCSVPVKLSPDGSICLSMFRLTPAKCLVIDDCGCLRLFSLPASVSSVKLPCSLTKNSICSVVGFKHTSEGLFAVVSGSSTVNIYSLADLVCSTEKGRSSYIQPFRALLSTVPINAMTFVCADQILLASSISKTLFFWGGISTTQSSS